MAKNFEHVTKSEAAEGLAPGASRIAPDAVDEAHASVLNAAAAAVEAPAGETGAGAVEGAAKLEAAAAPILQGAQAASAAVLEAFSPQGEGKAMGLYGEALFDSARAVAAEYVSWAGKSLERQAQGMGELLACKTPIEALEVQNRIIRDNVQALITTADKTARLTTQALSKNERPDV